MLFAGLSGNGIEGNDDSGLASNFIENAYQGGARGYFDAMAIHPYMLPDGGLNSLRAKYNRGARGLLDPQGTPQFHSGVTEIGVPSNVPWWSTAPFSPNRMWRTG